jgi:chaperonin GroES
LTLGPERVADGRAPQAPETRILYEDGVTSMALRPLHDRILVQRIEEEEQKFGGIIIPDSAKEKPQQGKVVAVGAGKADKDGKRIALDVKEGDTILFGKYSGQEVKVDGEDYLIMREDEVLAVIEGGKKQ